MTTSQIICITRPIPERAVALLRSKGHEVVMRSSHKAPTKRELLSLIQERPFTVLVPFLTDTIDSEIFTTCPTIRLVANYAVGYNNIDIEAAKEHGVLVVNTQGTSGRAVAETSVALMIALLTRIVEGDRYVRAKKYKGWDPYLLLGNDMYKKTVGLIGAGEIGSFVAHMVIQGFSCQVLYTDIKRNEALDALGAVYTTKEAIFAQADIISLHVPLLKETRHLINEQSIALMRPSTIIINTSRGPVVDETALVTALREGRIQGAGLDVFEFEPKVSRTLRKLPNTILTPHIASARASVREAMAEKIVAHITTFTEGGELVNLAK